MAEDRDPLETRLTDWFSAEVRRAERDLAAGTPVPAGVRRRRTLPALAVLGLTVAVAVGALVLRPANPRTAAEPTASPQATPAATGRAPATPGPSLGPVVLGEDGIPVEYEGQSVLSPAAAVVHAAAATSDTPFLVGGWIRTWSEGFGCTPLDTLSPAWERLLAQPGCGFTSVDAVRRTDIDRSRASAAIEADASLPLLGIGAPERPAALVIAQVHTRDALAAECPPQYAEACRAAVVLDEVLWREPPPTVVFGDDGLPASVAGRDVVRLGGLLPALSRDGSALVAGWFRWFRFNCAAPPEGLRESPLIPYCNGHRLLPAPSENVNDGISIVPADPVPTYGWAVAEVRQNDPRAEDCPEAQRETCRVAIVVERVWWSGLRQLEVGARHADGIPSELGGSAVLRPTDVLDGAGQDVLVGGWAHEEANSTWRLTETPTPAGLADGIRIDRLFADVDGPIVVRVGPGGSGCTPCRTAIELVWHGDAETRTEPLTISDVVARVAPVIVGNRRGGAGLRVEPVEVPGMCDPGFPTPTWEALGTDRVGRILVFGSVEAREAVDENFHADGWTGSRLCQVQLDGPKRLWVAAQNVIVEVILDGQQATADEAALADAVRAALSG